MGHRALMQKYSLVVRSGHNFHKTRTSWPKGRTFQVRKHVNFSVFIWLNMQMMFRASLFEIALIQVFSIKQKTQIALFARPLAKTSHFSYFGIFPEAKNLSLSKKAYRIHEWHV